MSAKKCSNFYEKKERVNFANKFEIFDTHKSFLYQKWLLFKEFFYFNEEKNLENPREQRVWTGIEGRDDTNGLKKYVIRLVAQNNTLQ